MYEERVSAKQLLRCAATEMHNDTRSFGDELSRHKLSTMLRHHDEQIQRMVKLVDHHQVTEDESAGTQCISALKNVQRSLAASLFTAVPLSKQQDWSTIQQLHTANNASQRNAVEQGEFAMRVVSTQTKAALAKELADLERLGFKVISCENGVVTISIRDCLFLSFSWSSSQGRGRWMLMKSVSQLHANIGGSVSEVRWMDAGIVGEIKETAASRGLAFACCVAQGLLCGTILNIIARQSRLFVASFAPHFEVDVMLGTERSSFVAVECRATPMQIKFQMDQAVTAITVEKRIGTNTSEKVAFFALLSKRNDDMVVDVEQLLWRHFGDTIRSL